MTRSANLTGLLEHLLPEALPPADSKGQQVRLLLEGLVHELGPGSLFPAERVLADHYGLAKMTVRQQVQALVAEGRLRRVPGRGTFVSEPRLMQLKFMSSFSKEMEARGLTPGGRVLSRHVSPADREMATRLGIEPGEPVVRIDRLRTADGVPMAFERTHLASRRFPGIESLITDDMSLRELQRTHYDCQPVFLEETISAVTLDAVEAQLLGVPVTSPALKIKGGTSDSAGQPIDFGHALYRADRFELTMHTGNGARNT